MTNTTQTSIYNTQLQAAPLASLGLLSALVLMGCDRSIDAKDIGDNNETGAMSVDVGGDATRDGGNQGAVPENVDSVWLRLDEVSIHHDEEGWVFIDEGRLNIDLINNREGRVQEIGAGDVYIGDYDTLRLSITDAWIVVDGVERDLRIDSGVDLDDGLDLVVPIGVNNSTTTAVWVGWDLDNLLDQEGNDWVLGVDVNLTVDVDDN